MTLVFYLHMIKVTTFLKIIYKIKDELKQPSLSFVDKDKGIRVQV